VAKQVTIVFGIVVGLIIIGLYSFKIYTKSFSPEGNAHFADNNGFEIKVEYSRPYKKGRNLFGNNESLIPYGKVWRTGANEATEISFNKDILVLGQKLKAGTYTLFTIPNDVSWTIIFNNELDQWGAFTYNESEDILRVKAASLLVPNETETFTIDFKEGVVNVEMRLFWGNTMVTIPFIIV